MVSISKMPNHFPLWQCSYVGDIFVCHKQPGTWLLLVASSASYDNLAVIFCQSGIFSAGLGEVQQVRVKVLLSLSNILLSVSHWPVRFLSSLSFLLR